MDFFLFFLLRICNFGRASVCFSPPHSFVLPILKHTDPLFGAPTRRCQKGVGSLSAAIGSIILANLMSPIQAEITQKHISVNGQQNWRYRPPAAWAKHLTAPIGTQFIRSLVELLPTEDQNKHLAHWFFFNHNGQNGAESGFQLQTDDRMCSGMHVCKACVTAHVRFLQVTLAGFTCEVRDGGKSQNIN